MEHWKLILWQFLEELLAMPLFEFYFENIGVPGVQTNVKLSRCYAPVQALQQRNRTASDLAHDLNRIWERAEFNDFNDNNRIQVRCCISLYLWPFKCWQFLQVAELQISRRPSQSMNSLSLERSRFAHHKVWNRRIETWYLNFKISYTASRHRDNLNTSSNLSFRQILEKTKESRWFF